MSLLQIPLSSFEITQTLLTYLSRYTPKGIEVGGPKEFGYKDMGVIPLGLPYYVPKRVTKEFRPRS